MDNIQLFVAVSNEINIPIKQISATWELLLEGATIPFLSRYRKEATGGLDEVEIAAVRDAMERAIELEKRREFVLKTILEQGKLSDDLKAKIEKADTITKIEDLYLPYKPKRKTKASIAKEKGLEPLADIFWEQNDKTASGKLAEQFVDREKDVKSTQEAIEGALHILAERINEDSVVRERIRTLFDRTARIKSKVLTGKDEEAQKYKDYFEWEEELKNIPSHRLLALRRGEKEGFLMIDVTVEQEEAITVIEKQVIKEGSTFRHEIKVAIEDSYKRLIKSSLETEFRLKSKKKADEEAIKVFADNLKELLLASPLGEKRILAVDPGFRSGCKVVALNAQGRLMEYVAIYPHEPQRQTASATSALKDFVKRYDIEAIAIGNGTAGRETEAFVKAIAFDRPVSVIVVNESGASVYSASEVARDEFPDQDVTVRGAVSIGRRLADPLAELVKIDPKAIGVGQYQHDVDQTALKNKLDEVVSSSVNAVGVDLNTASKELLTYVSGLGATIAKNIIDYRNEKGAFENRTELLKVPRMGAKAYEQAAGFLRIRNAKNVLDKTAVHPESYDIVKKMAKDASCTVEELITTAEKRAAIELKNYITEKVGLPTLQDIMKELEKPGRDPRAGFEFFEFAEGINKPEDLKIGMELNGIVTNVTKFGAFVDIGVHQDGLVHISELSNTFISDPNEVVKVNQKVKVHVTEVDLNRKRIALSMKTNEPVQKKGAKKVEKEPEGDMQSKLAALKGMWK